MARSRLQAPFMKDIAAAFVATKGRILRRLSQSPPADAEEVLEDELRGLYHGFFVVFDGGTALANKGLIQIIDEDGVAFDRNLHETCFKHWPERTG
jgi:hypothetical protein